MCDAHLNNGPLTCDRTDPHDAPRGCVFTATHGDDAHVESDALDSLPIAGLLQSRLASWFGDDRQSFLVADLVPVVTQIVSEFQWAAVDMARKADTAEAERDAALAEVERTRDTYGVELDRRLAAERACAAVLEVVEAYESCGPKRQCTRDVLDAVTEALVGRLTDDDCDHQWLDRPESDTRECLICGTEVAG